MRIVPSHIVLKFDPQGNVIPPEVYNSPGSKNWFARIVGRDEVYKWNRQFVPRIFEPYGGPKFRRSGFTLNDVYEFQAYYSIPNEAGKEERENRITSVYSGFWLIVGITEEGITMKRMLSEDMSVRFPRNTIGIQQATLEDFRGMENDV